MSTLHGSILFPDPAAAVETRGTGAAEALRDLGLDRVFQQLAAAWKDSDLMPFFLAPLSRTDAIFDRQEVMRDLETEAVVSAVRSFCLGMHDMRGNLALAEKLEYPQERRRWFLAAVQVYRSAVTNLSDGLASLGLRSRGLQALRDSLAAYIGSEPFRRLGSDADAVIEALSSVRYCVKLHGGDVTVLPYRDEADYTAVVEETFKKFRRGPVKDHRVQITPSANLNHVEARVLDGVARLHPDVFHALETFATAHADYLDDGIARFDREIGFYVAYLDFIEPLRRAGLSFCYAQVSEHSKEVSGRETFDLALAAKLVADRAPVVSNDFLLRDPERIVVVSGPNQGGKTTFARTFGQLHYLARLGCPVPGSEARLFLYDRLFTHFEREEDPGGLHGKLHDDLARVRRILEAATPDSIVVLNEIFSSTTLEDALLLSRRVMEEISRRDMLAVVVTFLDELATFDEKTVSMVSTVDPADPTVRTFRIERRAPDGLAYALAIAEKYRVTYPRLMERLGS
jgi:hypothetical protein